MSSNIIIYGGSFDPVHNDHLRIAKKAQETLGGVLLFVPNARPRWKDPGVSISDRVKMLELAIKDWDHNLFKIDQSELLAEGKDTLYSVDTLRTIKSKYPDSKLYFLIGGDSVNTFHDWRDPETIAHLAKIIYVKRKGQLTNKDNIEAFHMTELKVDNLNGTSSSLVRTLKSFDYPLEVREYILTKRLYYFKTLEKYLTPHRLEHSISVAKLADQIASIHKINDVNKAYYIGLLHDLAKDLDPKKLEHILTIDYPEYIPFPKWTYHQFVGASLARSLFGIEDEEILSAIRCHASGKSSMNPLEKIIYASDKIEPTRGYDSAFMIEAMKQDLDEGFKLVLKENMKYLSDKGLKIDNALTRACVEEYLKGEEYDH